MALGAFLLFQIQPIIAKAILPWFGGATAVWTTSLMFFQVFLLLGYLYAHWLQRFRSRRQGLIHLLLLAASLLWLPVAPQAAAHASGAWPAVGVFAVLASAVGLPYFLLASTGPLLQAWYAGTAGAALPYRLFAISNFGSLLGLLAYPLCIEPLAPTRLQLRGWSIGYAGFALICAMVALGRTRSGEAAESAAASSLRTPGPGWRTRTLWLALVACGSALLMAVTNQLCQNVAPVPFLWVLPLSLYLLSFILCFDREGWYRPAWFKRLLPLLVASMWYALVQRTPITNLPVIVTLFAAGLFVCCMFCHGELARLKPEPRHLTTFYLMIALGGAAGGLFVGLLAPWLFRDYFELQLALVACAYLALRYLFGYSSKSTVAGLALLAVITALISNQSEGSVPGARVTARNFYGALHVTDSGKGQDAVRKLYHGVITHGAQFLAPDRRREPTAYYARESGIGRAIEALRHDGQRVGVIGLGAGTLASYGRPGDLYRFYELNPLVTQLAGTEFTFLRDSRARVECVPGDARLSLEREHPQEYDVLAVDAFSGDAIPVHLLTREAFAVYFRHLRRNGVLAVHVSNQYLDLAPVVRGAAEALGKQALLFDSAPSASREVYRAAWVLLTSDFSALPAPRTAGVPIAAAKALRLWTDDYSNLLQTVR